MLPIHRNIHILVPPLARGSFQSPVNPGKMSYLINKAGFAAHIYEKLEACASLDGQETDGMRLMQLLAGMTAETLMLFEEPDEGIDATYVKLMDLLGC